MSYIQSGYDNESLYPRRDQQMLAWLWEAIVYGVGLQMRHHPYLTLEDVKQLEVQPEIMHVILDGEGEGLYWDNEWLGEEKETLMAAAAFLALRLQIHLVYPTKEAFLLAHPEHKEEDTEDEGASIVEEDEDDEGE